MNILGFPTAKLPAYSRTDSLSAKIKDYSKLDPQERVQRIDEDLVSLSGQREALRDTKAEAHSKAKAGLLTMVGGLAGTLGLSMAGDMLPGPLGTALKVGSAALTGAGVYSLLKNTEVRDFGTTEGLWRLQTQQQFLREWKNKKN